ncbi:MAG: hypothetical protein E7Z92_01550 [Cyanobacteria bacterium SIG31]|nr:hypothetical protein [Cyanobacteria bacterium SIG31]
MGLLRIDQIAATTGDHKAERIANEVDHRNKKSDGYLDDKELSIFMKKAKKEAVSDEVLNKIYNLANGSTGNVPEEEKVAKEKKQDKSVAEQPAVQAVTNPAKEDRTSRADRHADVKILNNAIEKEDVTLDNIADNVVGSAQTKEELKESIDYLKGVMNRTDKHHEAVAKIRKEKAGNAKYYIELLEKLEKLEEKDNVQEAFTLQKEEAEKAQGEDKVMSRADVKAGKKAVKKTGEYTGSETRQANRQLKDEVKAEARNIYAEYVKKVVNAPADEAGDIAEDKNLTRKNYIHRQAVKLMKKDGVWNELVKKGVNEGHFNDFWTGDDSFRSIVTETQAAGNDVEQSRIQNEKEVKKGTTNNTMSHLKRTLNGVEVEVRDELGNPGDKKVKLLEIKGKKWDLTGLSQEIRNILGADLELSQDSKDQITTAEFTNIKKFLESKMGTLEDSEVKEIIKLCGYDIEKKVEAGEVILAVLTLGFAGAGGGAATTENKTIVLPDTPVNVVVKVNGADKVVNTTIHELLDGGIIKFAGNVGANAALGAILPAIVGAIGAATKDKTQESTISLAFNENDYRDKEGNVSYDKYVAKLKENGNPHAQAAALIAGCFVKDGKWDHASYRKLLNSTAGQENDILNPKELLAIANDIKAGKISFEQEQEEVKPEEKTIVWNSEEQYEKTPVKNDLYHHYEITGGEQWLDIVRAFYPGLEAQFNGRFYDVYKNGKRVAEGAIGALKRALMADGKLTNASDIPPNLYLPLELKGIKLNPNGKVEKTGKMGGGRTDIKEAGEKKQGTTYISSKIGDIYVVADKSNPTVKYTGQTQEEAVQKLKKANPNVRYKNTYEQDTSLKVDKK